MNSVFAGTWICYFEMMDMSVNTISQILPIKMIPLDYKNLKNQKKDIKLGHGRRINCDPYKYYYEELKPLHSMVTKKLCGDLFAVSSN